MEEYEHFEQVENGDLNWLQEGKWVAFAGPHAKRECGPGGYYTLRPEDYVPYFKKKNVTLVVRLNKAYYDAKKFTNSGIDHLDLYFVDGSNPTEAILNRFITACEETSGAIAVHCKAGLGRTGTCIGCYIMKHYKFTAEEIIGWLRIARPGSIIGPQHQYMKEQQQRMWREGELHRARLRSLSNPDNNYSEKSEADTRMLTRSMAAMSVSDSNGHSNRHNSANGSRSTKQASSSLTSSSRISPVDAEIEGASQGDLLRLRRQQNANAVHGSTGDGSSYTTRSTALERSTLSDNGRVIASVSSFTYGSSKNGVESSKYVHTSIAAGGSSSSRNQLGSGKRNSSFGNFLSTWNK